MILKNRRHSYLYAIKTKDLIDKNFAKTVKVDGKMMTDSNTYRGKMRTVTSSFFYMMRLITDDCIDNNATFISPVQQWFKIFLAVKSEKAMDIVFKKMGKTYTDVNLVRSEGKIYEFKVTSPFFKARFVMPARIGYTSYKKIVEKVNNGFRYHDDNHGGINYRKLDDYVHKLHEKYPSISIGEHKRIMKYAFKRLGMVVSQGKDVLIVSRVHGIKFLIYNYRKPSEKGESK